MPVQNRIPFLDCHATVHDWDEIEWNKGASYGVTITYRCTECHAIKNVVVSRQSGLVLSRYYYLPDGYSNRGMSKADYRKVWLAEKLRKNLKVVS